MPAFVAELSGRIRSDANKERRTSSADAARVSDAPTRISSKFGAAETCPQSRPSALLELEASSSLKGQPCLRSRKSGSNLLTPAKKETGTWFGSIASLQLRPHSRTRKPSPAGRRPSGATEL